MTRVRLPLGAALTNLWVTALVVVATFAVALFVAVRVRGGRHDGIDVVWGLGFAIVASSRWCSRAARATCGGSC
jgi:steroid 5-alpha reductase family enzyme